MWTYGTIYFNSTALIKDEVQKYEIITPFGEAINEDELKRIVEALNLNNV